MDAGEPRVRRRGMFFHVETSEPDHGEHESAEGISIRQGPTRKHTHAIRTSLSQSEHTAGQNQPAGASRTFRSATATDSRRQARMSR